MEARSHVGGGVEPARLLLVELADGLGGRASPRQRRRHRSTDVGVARLIGVRTVTVLRMPGRRPPLIIVAHAEVDPLCANDA